MKRRTGILVAAIAFIGCSYVGDVGASQLPAEDIAFCDNHVAATIPAQLPTSRKAASAACQFGVSAQKTGMAPADLIKITDSVIEKAEATGDNVQMTAAHMTGSFVLEGFLYSKNKGL